MFDIAVQMNTDIIPSRRMFVELKNNSLCKVETRVQVMKVKSGMVFEPGSIRVCVP